MTPNDARQSEVCCLIVLSSLGSWDMNAYFCDFVMEFIYFISGYDQYSLSSTRLLNVCMYMYGDSSADIRSYARQTDDDVRLTLDLAY